MAVLRDIYLLAVSLFGFAATGAGGALITPHIPPVRPDAPGLSQALVTVVTLPGELVGRFAPASVVGMVVLAALTWTAQFALALATPVHQRLLGAELAESRGIPETQTRTELDRLPRRVRRREAVHISRALLIVAVIFAAAGAVLASLGWVLVLVVNRPLGTVGNVVAVVGAVLAVLVLGRVVAVVTESLIGTESADETYQRWNRP